MSSWTSVLQQLAALDPADFDAADLADEQLLDHAPLTQTGINRLNAVLTKVVAAIDRRQAHTADGMVTTKTWLIGHCRAGRRTLQDGQ